MAESATSRYRPEACLLICPIPHNARRATEGRIRVSWLPKVGR